MSILDNFIKLKENVFLYNKNTTIIAVTKTFSLALIEPLIAYGHKDFGENRVKEAKDKWAVIRKLNKNINLHMIGNLQSNKAEDAVEVFDFIHSLDNENLAYKLFIAEKKLNKKLKYFIQVNIGQEPQKSGINISTLDKFVNYCLVDIKLDVIGLMCIPPISNDSTFYFKKLKELAHINKLTNLSMGMSSDYAQALREGSNYIRVGSNIFDNK